MFLNICAFFHVLFIVGLVDAVNETWDLDGPCQQHIQGLAEAQAAMVKCATNYSSPPKVCTNCFDQYIAFKQKEWETHHLDNVTSLDNKSCSHVIYGNYLLSYSHEISESLTKRIWENSRCSSCLTINWDYEGKNSTMSYDKKTEDFQTYLFAWRDCVTNYSDIETGNNSAICQSCEKTFNDLFEYYWNIYTAPNVDFCVDVETTMNDTMNIWHNVWQCPDDNKKDRHHDVTMVAFSVTIFVVIIALFYAGSYIQTERSRPALVRYSRLEAPRGERSRLLSSSTLATTHLFFETAINMPEIDPNTDQLTQFREICEEKVAKFKEILEECNDRVNSKPGTSETCHEEMVAYVNALDHCALPKTFKHLK